MKSSWAFLLVASGSGEGAFECGFYRAGSRKSRIRKCLLPSGLVSARHDKSVHFVSALIYWTAAADHKPQRELIACDGWSWDRCISCNRKEQVLHRDGRPPPSFTPDVVYHFSLTITDKLLGLVILSGFAPVPPPLSVQSSFRRRLQGQETQQSGQFNEMSPAVSVSPTQDQPPPARMFLLSCRKYDKVDRPEGMFHMSIWGKVLLKDTWMVFGWTFYLWPSNSAIFRTSGASW